MSPFVAVPIRSFGGMARLAPALDPGQRARLSRMLAERAVAAVRGAGTVPAVVTGDSGVAEWAEDLGLEVVIEPATGGLDAAAASSVAQAGGRPWLFLHGDLPLVTDHDVAAVLAATGDLPVLAPSKDGGTSAVAWRGTFPFAFGPGSFHRHLRALGGAAAVVVRRGLAVDIDNPADLAVLPAPAGR